MAEGVWHKSPKINAAVGFWASATLETAICWQADDVVVNESQITSPAATIAGSDPAIMVAVGLGIVVIVGIEVAVSV